MSEEQNSALPQISQDSGGQKQAETLRQHATIVHDDGTRESVELESQRIWSGALPRPDDFAKFGEIVPDAPERILRMAEKEQAHRIAMEQSIVPAESKAMLRGQYLGWSIAVLALVLAVVSEAAGAPWQLSSLLVGVPVLSVAKTLISAIKSPKQ